MYNSYYSLAFNPFDKQQVKENDAFVSKDYTEMTSRLNYLKDTRGIGVFTSSPGRGKSFCLRCFAKSLNPNLYHMEYIPLSTITVAEFYKELCTILGVSDKGGKPGRFRSVHLILLTFDIILSNTCFFGDINLIDIFSRFLNNSQIFCCSYSVRFLPK